MARGPITKLLSERRNTMTKRAKALAFSVDVYHVDTCLPDYWPGTTKPYLQVPVGRRTTYADMRQMLADELRMGQVQGAGTVARLLTDSSLSPENQKVADRLVRKLNVAFKEDVVSDNRGSRYPFFHTLTDTSEGVYAYFTIDVIGHLPVSFPD